MPHSAKENVRKRVGPLSRKLYELFVRYLHDGQMATISELQQAHFKFASPTRLAKLVKIQKSTIRRHGRKKAPYQRNILAQDAEGYVIDRFKTWASRMRLNGKEQLLYAATAKVILPKEDFPKLVMSLHNKGEDSTGKHRSFMKTLQLVKNTYSIGRRQFGISEFAIRKIVSSCQANKCNSRLPDQGCHAGERLHLDSDESVGSSTSAEEVGPSRALPQQHCAQIPELYGGREQEGEIIDLTIKEPLKKRLKRMASQDPNLTGLTDTCGDTSCTTGAAVTSETIALKMIPVNPLYVSSNDNQAMISPSTFDPERPLNLTNRSVAHSTNVSSTVTMPMYLMVPVHSLKDRVGTHSEVSAGSTPVSSGELTRLLLTPSAAGITSISNIRGAQTTLVTQSVMNTPPLKISKPSSIGYVEKWQEFWQLMKLMRPEIRHAYIMDNKYTDRLSRLITRAHESVTMSQLLLKEVIDGDR